MSEEEQVLPSDEELIVIRQLVRAEPWIIFLPVSLLPAYGLRRQHEFRRLVDAGSPLLILLQGLLMGYALLMYFPAVTGPHHAIWWAAEALVSLQIAVGLLLARIPAMLPRYLFWVGAMATGILAVRLAQTFALTDPALRQHQAYVCILVIMVIVLALRLTIMANVVACTSALMIALVAAWLMRWTVDFRQLLVYHGQAVTVALFVAFLLERQQRLAFLQSVLLDSESAEKQRLNDRLERLAREDGLTGLANRRHFDQMLVSEWERASREGRSLALLMVDVDHFKAFNDFYGHPAGDECLVRMGALLREAARRPGDVAARYGGEEFVVLLPGTGMEGARDVAQRLLDGIFAEAIPHEASSVSERVTVSIGLAVFAASARLGPQALVDAADAALYQAKHQGRSRLVVADGSQ